MANLGDLAIRMRALAATIPAAGNAPKQRVAAAVLQAVIEASPADTSRFISNWRVGSAVGEAIDPYFPGAHGSTRQESAATATAEGLGAIDASLPGQPIVIYNAVPYAAYIDDGSPGHAAYGLIARGLLVGQQMLAAIAAGVSLG